MNLKESFRYQKFLETLMKKACWSVESRENALITSKIHHRNKVNPDVEDMTEEITSERPYDNNDVMRLMSCLVLEREKLTQAINAAKRTASFDIDAAIITNKFRRSIAQSLQAMLGITPYKRIETGHSYKFNVEGNQTQYLYDVEVITKEAYDKDYAKQLLKSIVSAADEVSSEIDKAMVTIEVDYELRFDINQSFDDIMSDFIKEEATEQAESSNA